MNQPHFTILVDNEAIKITDRTMTVRALLVFVGLDPDCFYLIEVRGRHQESYRDRLEEELKLHPNQRFVTAHIEAVCPVS